MSAILDIKELHRQREDLVRADVRLTNHIKAIERRGGTAGAALSLAAMRQAGTPFRKGIEREMERRARALPVWPWVASVRGFGALGLAQIVGECGDLADYRGPACLWKRMGLAVMPDGARQRRVSGDEAILHGFNPHRRSIMYSIGDSLIKGNRDGEYRSYYLAEKMRQRAKLPDAPQIHVHMRAQRHMEKRLLRDLWRAWRDQTVIVAQDKAVPPDATDRAAD